MYIDIYTKVTRRDLMRAASTMAIARQQLQVAKFPVVAPSFIIMHVKQGAWAAETFRNGRVYNWTKGRGRRSDSGDIKRRAASVINAPCHQFYRTARRTFCLMTTSLAPAGWATGAEPGACHSMGFWVVCSAR